MAKAPYRLAPSEVEIIRRGIEDPNLITDYFFRPKGGEKGFRFDYRFTAEGAWQKQVCTAEQKTMILIGGVGTGKTLGIGMAACVWALTTEDFMFLNVAQKAWQAKLMYDLILKEARNTPFEDLIWEKPRRPHPKLILKFYIGDKLYESSLEFMSVDRDATGLFSWRGDWINIEEAGLLDNLDEIWANLSTRLTGSTPRGRAFEGRLSAISNPWDTPYMWQLFDLASSTPEDSLSMVMSTRDNKNVTDDQLQRLLTRLPKEEHERFIDGQRPEGKGEYFSRDAIEECESELMTEVIELAVEAELEGYTGSKAAGSGMVNFTTPPAKDRIYMVFGDPGTGEAPLRNAPVIMVWDVTEFPEKPAILSAFWWGYGWGKIFPFVYKLLELKERYNAIYTATDSTATQKYTAEIINLFHFSDTTDGIRGLDFSGSKKMAYLVVLRTFIEAKRFVWPDACIGIRHQLAMYDPVVDKKLAQDIVATMAMAAWAMRVYFHVDPEDLKDDGHIIAPVSTIPRLSNKARNRRTTRARPSKPRTPEKQHEFAW